MKGSLIVLAIFVVGIAIGILHIVPESYISVEVTEWLLYALVIQIGISLGYGGNMRKIFKSLSTRTLLLPLCTIIGTLAFTALAGLCLGKWNIAEYLALGSGLGYYSLSSVIIVDMKEETIGLASATQLGMLALLVNIIREMIALIFGPWLARVFGKYAPVTAAGVTSMDVNLPMIVKSSGQEITPIAVTHGVFLEISVPLLVTFFAGL